MVSELVPVTGQASGEQSKTPKEFPVPSLRQFLIPDTLVHVKFFVNLQNLEELNRDINRWVDFHKVILATVSVPVQENNRFLASVTYVSPDGRPIADG